MVINDKTAPLNGKLQSAFKAFTNKYLLVEELSGSYKPIYTKEYPAEDEECTPLYPKLHRTTKIPFVIAATSCVEEMATNGEHDSGDNPPEEVDDAADPLEFGADNNYSTASGLISGSMTALVRAQANRNDVNKLNKKNFEPRATVSTKPIVQKKSKVSRGIPQNVSAFFSKGGYCENCSAKYDDFYEVYLNII